MKHRMLPTSVLALGAAMPLLSVADPQPAQPDVTSADKLEQIVVTARRREESLQSVPAAVTALTARQIRDLQVDGSTDLERVVSNTTMTDENSIVAGTLTAFIRGIGTDPGFQQGVGVYIDDMYLQSPLGTDVSVYSNIERIEVLKGPQGNLYGRNTIGGAIKYVTRDPNDEGHASAEIRGGRFNLRQATADLSGPLSTGKLYGDVGILWKQRDGFQNDITTGQTLGSIDQRAVHGLLKWLPAEGVSVKFGGAYSLDESHPRAPAFLGTLPAPAPFNAVPQMVLVYDLLSARLPPAFLGNPVLGAQLAALEAVLQPIAASNTPGLNTPPVFPALGPDQTATNMDYTQFLTESSNAFLTGQWAITDRWSAKSATTYRRIRVHNNLDLDGLPQSYLDTFQRFKNEDFSQEFQFNYAGENAALVAGVYYLHGRDGIPSSDTVSPRVQLTQTTTEIQSESLEEVKSTALYGNLDYNLTKALHLSVGGRYTNEDVGIVLHDLQINTTFPLLVAQGLPLTFPIVNSPLAVATAQAVAAGSGGLLQFVPASSITVPTDVSPSTTFRSFSPSGKLAYDFGPQTMGYVGYSAGYKAGGFDTFRPFTKFDPEKVGSYSVGLKTTTPDGKLRINTEAFYNDYKDKQFSTVVLIGNTLGKVTRNAGQVHTYGADADITWLTPIPRLRLGLTAGYLQTEVVHFFQANSTGTGTVDSGATTRLGFSPKWTGSVDLMYTALLGGVGDLTFDGNLYYRSQSYTDSPIDITSAAAGIEVQRANAIANAGITYRTSDDHWRVALEGRNLTDKRVLTNTFNASVGSIIGQYNDPRTWSVSIGYNFK